jgi:hypothetical protein
VTTGSSASPEFRRCRLVIRGRVFLTLTLFAYGRAFQEFSLPCTDIST